MATIVQMNSVADFKRLASWPVGSCDFLHRLTPKAANDFESISSFYSCASDTILFSEQDPSDEIFFLLQGEIKLYVTSVEGKRFILRIAKPGDILGLASAFANNMSEMTAETMYPCEIAQVPRADFIAFIGRYPPVLRDAMREMSRYYAQACTRLLTMGLTSSIPSKVARLLLEWATRIPGQSQSHPRRIHISLNHTEIGECIGTSRESITRVLSDWQRRAIIEMRGSILIIVNLPALEACAGAGSPGPGPFRDFKSPRLRAY